MAAFLGAACLSALVGVGLVAGPAWAHVALLATSPAADVTVVTQVSEVTLTFNEPVNLDFSTVVVTGPDDSPYGRGELRQVDNVLHQPVYPLRSGEYRVAWRVVAADGHPVSGEFAFDVSLPAGLEPTAPPPTTPPSTPPTGGDEAPGAGWVAWWWVPAAAGGLAAVGVGWRRRVRTR